MTHKRARILLLDDDYESMQSLKAHLEEELGWEVELSAERTLLERLGSEQFDLIIVDSMIHSQGANAEKNIHYDDVKWDRTGLEFVRRFRSGEYSREAGGTPASVPIIVLSAVANSAANGEWGKIIKKEHHVEKPFRLSDLVNLIQSLLKE